LGKVHQKKSYGNLCTTSFKCYFGTAKVFIFQVLYEMVYQLFLWRSLLYTFL